MNIKTLTKKEKQVAVLLVFLLVFMFIYLFLLRNNEPKIVDEVSDATVQEKLPPKFSRITFFHTAKPICTLAIPDNWEGRYRLQDNGGVAHFLYIQEVGNPEMFYIKKYKKNEKPNNTSERKILENKSSNYVVGLSTASVDKFVQKNDFENMMNSLDEILKSFKCF